MGERGRVRGKEPFSWFEDSFSGREWWVNHEEDTGKIPPAVDGPNSR
jgi:hypothetical protein